MSITVSQRAERLNSSFGMIGFLRNQVFETHFRDFKGLNSRIGLIVFDTSKKGVWSGINLPV